MTEERSLIDVLAIARKRWLWVLVPIVLLTALAVWFTNSQTLAYEATARVLLQENASARTLDPGSQNPSFLERELENDLSLALGPDVEALVLGRLGNLPNVTVAPETETDILEFRARTGSPESAAEAANVWAESYLQVRQERGLASIQAAATGLETRLTELRSTQDELRAPLEQLRRQIRAAATPEQADRLQQDYNLLEDELRFDLDLTATQAQTTADDLAELGLQAELAAATPNQLTEPAEVPDGPANTPLSRILVIAIVAGAVIGIGLAVIAEARDRSLRTSDDVEAITNLPILASIPVAGRNELATIGLATMTQPESMFADGYHKLRSALEFELLDTDIDSIMITSPGPGAGRTTVAANLALAASSVGTRTALVDADFRAGAVHDLFQIPPLPGLSDLVRRDVEAPTVAREIAGEAARDLVVIPCGTVPPSPASFVSTPRFLSTLSWMGSQADLLLVDAPPLLAIPEAHTLARNVGGVIVTVMVGKTTGAELKEALAVLAQTDIKVLGLVLVGVPKTKEVVKRYYRDSERSAMGWAQSFPMIEANNPTGSGSPPPDDAVPPPPPPSDVVVQPEPDVQAETMAGPEPWPEANPVVVTGPEPTETPAAIPAEEWVPEDPGPPPTAAELVDSYDEFDVVEDIVVEDVVVEDAVVEDVVVDPEAIAVNGNGHSNNGHGHTNGSSPTEAEAQAGHQEDDTDLDDPDLDDTDLDGAAAESEAEDQPATANSDASTNRADWFADDDEDEELVEAVEPLEQLGDMTEVDAEEIEAEIVDDFDPMVAAVTLEVDHATAQAIIAELGDVDTDIDTDIDEDDVIDLDDLVEQNDGS